jgi:hypothetical protein
LKDVLEEIAVRVGIRAVNDGVSAGDHAANFAPHLKVGNPPA